VSDFLARVAARAVGQAALARPRPPALFERPAGGAFEVVDHERPEAPDAAVAGTRAESPARPAAAAGPPARAHEPPSAPAPAPAEPRAPAAAPPTAAAAAPGGRTPAAHEPVPAEERAPSPGPGAAAAVPVTVAAAQPAAAPVVPARPAAPVAAVHAAPAPASAPPAATPPVSVRIGRLEVRASLHDAPSRPPRRESSPARELSLADYLRGRRESA
jgi:hypothetical protein